MEWGGVRMIVMFRFPLRERLCLLSSIRMSCSRGGIRQVAERSKGEGILLEKKRKKTLNMKKT